MTKEFSVTVTVTKSVFYGYGDGDKKIFYGYGDGDKKNFLRLR